MRHRVRAAALILRSTASSSEILLVKHQHSKDPNKLIWLPPGGGLESKDASIFACAQREALEETGLTIQTSHIAYIHEFIDQVNQIRHVAFYMAVTAFRGELSLEYRPQDDTNALMTVLEPVWMRKEDLPALNLYPAHLKYDEFWGDVAQGFPQTKYLEPMRSL